MVSSKIYESIKRIVGKECITDSEFEKIFYSRDVSPLPEELQLKLGTNPDIIVRPKTAKEISEILKVAVKNKIPIIPRGGASWWLGGAVPFKGGIVIDLTSMNEYLNLDKKSLTITADCGVTWKELMDYLDRKSFFLGIHPGSAASATVGGWISTGGVGIGSYKYGSVGDLVRSLEVVLPNGEIINTANKELASHGSGYDLNGLFVGGEGTLGVITKATLKITPKPKLGPYHFSFAFSDIKSCHQALERLVTSRILPYHIAFGDKKHFSFLKSIDKKVPEGEIVLCICLEGEKGIIDYGEKKLREILKTSGGTLGCENKTGEDCQNCTIEFRGRQVSVYPVPGEIFVGLNHFEEALSEISKLRDEMALEVPIIGSMVDRRTVMFMPYYIPKKDVDGPFMDFHRRLEQLAFKLGGRGVGLGLYFSSNLQQIHDPGSVEIMRKIKKIIDPNNIMNPGKTLGETNIFKIIDEP
jgi:glycolate oxidase